MINTFSKGWDNWNIALAYIFDTGNQPLVWLLEFLGFVDNNLLRFGSFCWAIKGLPYKLHFFFPVKQQLTLFLVALLLTGIYLNLSEKWLMSQQCFEILIFPFFSYLGWCPTNG